MVIILSSQAKLLVILSSSDLNKVLTGLLYATNALKYKWVSDVKVVFFGPSEKFLSSKDSKVLSSLKQFLSYTKEKPLACKFVAEQDGTINDLQSVSAEMGIDVKYVGSIVSSYISQGYIPMVF